MTEDTIEQKPFVTIDDVQIKTDKFIGEIDKLLKLKQDEIMKV